MIVIPQEHELLNPKKLVCPIDFQVLAHRDLSAFSPFLISSLALTFLANRLVP